MVAPGGRRKKPDESQRWLETYSDMVTLLLTFFVLLFAFSNLDVQKFKAFITSFQGMGILQQGPEPLEGYPSSPAEDQPGAAQEPPITTPENQTLAEVYGSIQSYLEEHDLSGKVTLEMRGQSIIMDIKEQVLFDTGKAELRPDSYQVLDPLAGLFRTLTYQVVVEGHTDNTPINTYLFPTNWELSTVRATTVVRYFTEHHGLPGAQFGAAGYGEFHPVAANDTPEHKALNRRVVFLVNVENERSGEGAD